MTTRTRDKMPLEKCASCSATMQIKNVNQGYPELWRSICPRCMYFEDYHKDSSGMWCIDAGYLDEKDHVAQCCMRCGMKLDIESRVRVKIQGESILAERHELCRTCLDVIKYWLSSNSRKYQQHNQSK